MKKGKWNYTEDIHYKVVLVRLLAVPDTPLHWQNAFVGEERQAAQVEYPNQRPFLIDNQDGSGLKKISMGGGPDSYSAHVDNHEFIRELPEEEWQQYDPVKFDYYRLFTDKWQQDNYPEEHEKLKKLKESFATRFSSLPKPR